MIAYQIMSTAFSWGLYSTVHILLTTHWRSFALLILITTSHSNPQPWHHATTVYAKAYLPARKILKSEKKERIDAPIKSRGGVLEDVFEDTFWSPWPWPWPRSLKSLALASKPPSPRKLSCPRLEDSPIFWTVEISLENPRNFAENLRTPFLFSSIGA